MTEQNQEFDLKLLVGIIDTAIESDNPAVKKCLKDLFLTVALAHSDEPKKQKGLLTDLVNSVDSLSRDMRSVISWINNTTPNSSWYDHSTSSYYKRPYSPYSKI